MPVGAPALDGRPAVAGLPTTLEQATKLFALRHPVRAVKVADDYIMTRSVGPANARYRWDALEHCHIIEVAQRAPETSAWHELVHAAQCDALGGYESFRRAYAYENRKGYERNGLERQAERLALRLARQYGRVAL